MTEVATSGCRILGEPCLFLQTGARCGLQNAINHLRCRAEIICGIGEVVQTLATERDRHVLRLRKHLEEWPASVHRAPAGRVEKIMGGLATGQGFECHHHRFCDDRTFRYPRFVSIRPGWTTRPESMKLACKRAPEVRIKLFQGWRTSRHATALAVLTVYQKLKPAAHGNVILSVR